ncbi:hypothetical protein CVT24_000363 [Panaeolus cyanescens]|uniref:Uncharacterized protein n=1 Tax=Panaeolus cyanescens TaxID=181874 RepID=A0A409VRT5_9AGAR|nr:hypothetical protein CVT24_000363 [Panaeolus cyanescens]
MNSPTSSSSSRRKSSLRLAQPPPIPVPPSLRTSPYLNCPAFKQDITSPRLPTEEEERWLQDTVPLSAEGRPISAAPTIGPSPSQNRIPCLARHSTFPTTHLSSPSALAMSATASAQQRHRSGTIKQRVRSGPDATTNQSATSSPSEPETGRLGGDSVGRALAAPLLVTPDGLGWSAVGLHSSSGSRTPSDPQFARLGVGDQESYFHETSFH